MNTIGGSWQSPRLLVTLSIIGMIALQTALFLQSASVRSLGSSDGGVKLWQVRSVLRTGRLDAPIEYAGRAYDPDHKYSPFITPWFFWQAGKPYSEYISPFIWISAPLYAVFDHAGLLVWPWLAGCALVMLAGWLAWRIRPDRSAALAPVFVGIGSPLLLYGAEFWEHTPGAFLAVFALAGIIKATDGFAPGYSVQTRWLIASGAAIGLGLTMRAELYVFPIAVVIGLLAVRSDAQLVRSLLFLAIGGLTTAGAWWLYQLVRWGSPFGPRLQQNVPLLGGTDMLGRLGDATGRNWIMLWPGIGEGLAVLAIAGLAALMLTLLARTLRLRAPRAASVASIILVLTLLAIAALTMWRIARWQLVVDQRPNDLLSTFPLILLVFWLGSRSGTLPNRIALFAGVVSAAFAALVIVASPFDGGVQWGPRFLLPVITPAAAVIAAGSGRASLDSGRGVRASLVILIIGLLTAGAYSTWRGVEFMQEGRAFNARVAQAIDALPEQVVVADAWFLPQAAAYTFDQKMWFLAEDKDTLFDLIQVLRKQTDEPGMIFVSMLTWNHLDPLVIMGPRIAPNGEPRFIETSTLLLQIAQFFLYD